MREGSAGLDMWKRSNGAVRTAFTFAGLGGSVGCAVQLETRRSRVQLTGKGPTDVDVAHVPVC